MEVILSVLGPAIILIILFSLPISIFAIIYYLSNIPGKEYVKKTRLQLSKDRVINKLKRSKIESEEYKLLVKKLLWIKKYCN
jgi:hypothetical protein